MSTTTMEMAQLLGDSFLESFDVVIDLHSGERVTGKVNQLLHEGVEVLGPGITFVVRIEDIIDVNRLP